MGRAGCNRGLCRLQPQPVQAATVRGRGCNRMSACPHVHPLQDLLDPEGWEHGDRSVVLAAAARQVRPPALALALGL